MGNSTNFISSESFTNSYFNNTFLQTILVLAEDSPYFISYF